MEGRK
jgi:hypothetical protein